MLLSIIIPCYNEEAVIGETHRRLTFITKTLPHGCELIFINDGSTDGTLSILTRLAESDKTLKVINFSRNFGHQRAITAGLNLCKGGMAAIIDADLQDPPELIPEMITLMQSGGFDHVYAVRKKRAAEPLLRLLISKVFYRLLNFLSEVPIPVDTGDFRLINRAVINTFNSLDERNKYVRGLMGWMGFRQVPFYYDRDPRLAGETKYPFRKSLKLALTGIFYFSKKPLDISIFLGFVCIFLGLGYSAHIFLAKIFGIGRTDSGWASLMCTFIFFGGIQLLTLGILGKYVGNLFDEAKHRPEYIVRDRINFD